MKIEIDPHLLEMVNTNAKLAANEAISATILEVSQRSHVPATVVRDEFFKAFPQWKRSPWDLRSMKRAPDARDLRDSLVSGT